MIVDKIKTRLIERLNKSSDVAGLIKELKKAEAQKGRLLDLYLSESIDIPAYNERKLDIEKAIEYYTAKIEASTPIDPSIVTFDTVKSSIDKFLSSVVADTYEYKRLLLSTFVDCILIDNENIVIYFKFDLPGTGDHSDFVCKRATTSTLAVCGNISTGFTYLIEYSFK